MTFLLSVAVAVVVGWGAADANSATINDGPRGARAWGEYNLRADLDDVARSHNRSAKAS